MSPLSLTVNRVSYLDVGHAVKTAYDQSAAGIWHGKSKGHGSGFENRQVKSEGVNINGVPCNITVRRHVEIQVRLERVDKLGVAGPDTTPAVADSTLEEKPQLVCEESYRCLRPIEVVVSNKTFDILDEGVDVERLCNHLNLRVMFRNDGRIEYVFVDEALNPPRYVVISQWEVVRRIALERLRLTKYVLPMLPLEEKNAAKVVENVGQREVEDKVLSVTTDSSTKVTTEVMATALKSSAVSAPEGKNSKPQRKFTINQILDAQMSHVPDRSGIVSEIELPPCGNVAAYYAEKFARENPPSIIPACDEISELTEKMELAPRNAEGNAARALQHANFLSRMHEMRDEQAKKDKEKSALKGSGQPD